MISAVELKELAQIAYDHNLFAQADVFEEMAAKVATREAKIERSSTYGKVPYDTGVDLIAERERIYNAFADFFQYEDTAYWRSPTGRVFDDLGNGRGVGYDFAKFVITKYKERGQNLDESGKEPSFTPGQGRNPGAHTGRVGCRHPLIVNDVCDRCGAIIPG